MKESKMKVFVFFLTVFFIINTYSQYYETVSKNKISLIQSYAELTIRDITANGAICYFKKDYNFNLIFIERYPELENSVVSTRVPYNYIFCSHKKLNLYKNMEFWWDGYRYTSDGYKCNLCKKTWATTVYKKSDIKPDEGWRLVRNGTYSHYGKIIPKFSLNPFPEKKEIGPDKIKVKCPRCKRVFETNEYTSSGN